MADSTTPTTAPMPAPQPVAPRRRDGGGIFSFFLRPFIRIGHEKGNPKVHVTSFSTLMYLWPIMVFGMLGKWLHSLQWANDEVLGWVWVTTVLVVMICIGADLNRTKTAILGLLVLLLWVFGLLLKSKWDIPVLTHIHAYLANQNVRFDPGMAKVFSIAIFIILLGVLFGAWLDGRYEITTMEITHRRVFETSDSLPRAANRIKRDWRDITEAILGLGAGDVIVIDSNKNVVMRIPNVPFLWFFRHEVDHVLEVLATTSNADDQAPEQAS